jgi:hypothetical protein
MDREALKHRASSKEAHTRLLRESWLGSAKSGLIIETQALLGAVLPLSSLLATLMEFLLDVLLGVLGLLRDARGDLLACFLGVHASSLGFNACSFRVGRHDEWWIERGSGS